MRIPETIQECFEILDALVDESSKEDIKNKTEIALLDLHFSLGMLIRNNWLYDETSPFVKFLRLEGLSWLDADSVSAFLIKLYFESSPTW